MRQFFTGITRREKQFTVAGIVLALVLFMPFLAIAEPGMVSGSGPGDPVDPGAEQALDVERGDSCRDTLPADTPSYVVCTWLTPPQDALEVAAFWAADGGANLKAAQPLPAKYVRCNQKTDLSKFSACKGGETACKQRPDGWYECRNMATGKTTYERTINGKRQVRTTAPEPSATGTPAAQATPAAPSTAQPEATDSTTSGTTENSGTAAAESTPTITPPAALPPDGDTSSAASPAASPTSSSTGDRAAAGEPVTTAIEAARAAHLRVWVESDLADDYLAGDAQFRAALDALSQAARQPGVIGIKFTDNLGYSRFSTEADIRTFLTSATRALRAAAPGKRLAIGVVVPELGCGSSQPCITAMRAKAPLVTKQLVGRYIKASGVEHVYVSSGLFATTYRTYQVTHPKTGKPTPITPALATRAQWLSIKALGWDTLAQIGSREYGLAHTGDTADWSKAVAAAQISARIGTVIGLGAPTVTLWGHKAADGDQTYRLLDAGLAPNEVWQALTAQRLRERLSVVFDPASTEAGVSQDIAALAKGVSEIFILT
ncbi:hypothetical protein [Nonomuraea sp. NPDC023979]|uniref:hypothetical protein n=1 Tax=Nonomuraea sp. NPDC023979 TaxID=3154796 RepID=UPI0033FCA2F3